MEVPEDSLSWSQLSGLIKPLTTVIVQLLRGYQESYIQKVLVCRPCHSIAYHSITVEYGKCDPIRNADSQYKVLDQTI